MILSRVRRTSSKVDLKRVRCVKGGKRDNLFEATFQLYGEVSSKIFINACLKFLCKIYIFLRFVIEF